MYYLFNTYVRGSCGRIYNLPNLYFSASKTDAENSVLKCRIGGGEEVLGIEFISSNKKYEIIHKKYAKFYNYEHHQFIAKSKDLEEMDIEIPDIQRKSYEYPFPPEPEIQEPKKKEKPSLYNKIKCPYCDDKVSSNGAAQFSHLKKHVRELVKEGAITKRQASGIRSIKLTPRLRKIFKDSFTMQ